MTPITVFASLTTAAALGVAGYATLNSAPGTLTGVAASTSDATQSSAGTPPVSAPSAAQVPGLQDQRGVDAPRECRPEDGVVTECTYL